MTCREEVRLVGPWRRLGSMAFLSLLAGCDILGLGGRERTLVVAAYKVPCYGLFPMLCLQVREPGEATFTSMYDTPRGFDFEWGFDYVIVVEERTVSPAPVDGSSIARTLERVVSRDRVPRGSTFQWPLFDPAEFLVVQDTSTYGFYSGQVVLSCTLGPSCGELADAVPSGAPILLTLGYPDVQGGPLPILGWTRCDPTSWPCGGH